MRIPVAWMFPLLTLLVLPGCGGYGEVLRSTESVEPGEAETADISIEMDTGNLNVAGQSEELMAGSFEYNADLEPQISYGVDGSHGSLLIMQKSASGLRFGDASNTWDILLNPMIPRQLTVKLSSADAELQLGSLQLERIEIDTSSGDVSLRVNEEQSLLISSSINSSSGDLDATFDGSYASLQNIDVNSSSGDIKLDISGEWASNSTISIKSSSGDVELTIPGSVGVRVQVETSSGDVVAPEMTVNGSVYTSESFGKNADSIEITVMTSSGDVTIQQR